MYTVVNENMLRNRVGTEADATKVCISPVSDMDSLFYNKYRFNQDIDNWDVTWLHGTSKTQQMFEVTIPFNQDLTSWCVKGLGVEPARLSFSIALKESNKPIWGTCP